MVDNKYPTDIYTFCVDKNEYNDGHFLYFREKKHLKKIKIILIPGNPGFVDFYDKFLSIIHERFV
jgi:hypothetical protein